MNDLHNYTIPKFVSISDLQRDYSSILDTLHSSQEPLLVLKKNKTEAVILTPEAFQSLINKARQFEEKQAREAVQTYSKEKKENKLEKMNSVEDLFND